MLSVKRRLAGLAAGCALAVAGTAAVPVAAHAAPGDSICVNRPDVGANRYIRDHYQRLGGADSKLGCPIEGMETFRSGGTVVAQRQKFDNGDIAWSPRQGDAMVVTAWEYQGAAFFSWGPTRPFDYDLFLVRYTSAADAFGTQRSAVGGTWGGTLVRKETTGAYTFIVEGCDDGTWGLTCNQGWTLPVSTR
ncbi:MULTISPECIES: LGFP repeat-containing protein [unclassified Streptomyces]|uniref:hypothetical protein n=1 Tax=unclassified Streptomyces TaxID=2593676 RepID=UPI0033BE7481